MPFTVSHIAAILPYKAPGIPPLPFAALAVGSMAPDLVFYIPPLMQLGVHTHFMPFMFTFNVVLALLVWAAWRVIAPGVYEVSPQIVRQKWLPDSWGTHAWWTVPFAICAGIATHIILDNFTHSWGWGPAHLASLRAEVSTPFGPMFGYELAQWIFGFIGLGLLLAVALWLPRQPSAASRTPVLQALTPFLVGAAILAGGFARVMIAGGLALRFESQMFYLLTGGMIAGAVTAAALSLVALVAVRLRRVPAAA